MEVREPSAKYLARPSYKQTEVGVIPEDWGVTTVGDEFSVQLGKMLDSEKNVGVQKPFLGNRAVQWGRIDLSDIGVIKLTPSDLQRFRLRDGDLLVCEGGEIGRAAIWRGKIAECYYQKALHRLRPKRGYNVTLMLNVLQRLASTGFLLNFVTQTSIAHLPKDKFEGVPVPLPPTKAEQEAIAESLSDADALIESLEQLLVKKRNLKQGAMQELLTGKKRLPGFSGKWKMKRLTELAVLSKIGVNPATSPTAFFSHFSLPAFDARAVPVIEQGSCIGSNKFVVPAQAVLVSKLNPRIPRIWAPSYIPGNAVCSTEFLVLVPREGTDRDFLATICRSPAMCYQMELHATGTTGSHQRMNPSQALTIELSAPEDQAEQTAITSILSGVDAEIGALEAKLAKARHLKQGMMQDLLTGRIRLV